MKTIYERLDAIISKVTDKSFMENEGLNNKNRYYIFDYEPKYELLVREHIEFVKEKINYVNGDINIIEFDLYEIMIEILESKGYLKKNMDMEEKKGSEFVFNATKKALRLALNNDMIVQYISERVSKNHIIFITGVGKAWPIITPHTVLNNLHKAIEQVPVIMFFPGSFHGLELVLFDEIKDDNYYRVSPLIED